MSIPSVNLYETVTEQEFPNGLLCERCFGQIHNGHAFVTMPDDIQISDGGTMIWHNHVVGFCCLERDPREIGLLLRRGIARLGWIKGRLKLKVANAIIGKSGYPFD